MDLDLLEEPLGQGDDGEDVYLRDVWPTSQEINDVIASSVESSMFERTYADVFTGDDMWRELPVPEGDMFECGPDSTYIRLPHYLDRLTQETQPVVDFL